MNKLQTAIYNLKRAIVQAATRDLVRLSCFLFGHAWRYVYRKPYSQHPVSVTRPHATKTIKLGGEIVPDIELKIKCTRCKKESWR